jgi:hypothetical protein
MKRALKILGRTALLVVLGAVLMIGIGQLFALTTATCSTICKPQIAAPLGAILGLMLAVILPSLAWKPLDNEQDVDGVP